MDTSKIIFVIFLFSVCTFIGFYIKNRPRYILCLMIFFAPMKLGWVFRHNNGIFLVDVPLFLLLIIALLSERRFKFYWALPVFGFMGWSLLTGLLAVRFDIVFSELTRFLRAYLAFLCVIHFARTKKDFDAIFYTIIACFAFNSFIGFLEWRTGHLGLSFMGEESFWIRAGGLFIHPNIFGDFLIFLLPLLLRMFAFYKHKKRIHNGYYGLLFLIGLSALLATYARGAWLSFAGAVIIMLLYSLFKIRFYPKVVGAAAFLVLLATIFAVHYTPAIVSQFEGDYRGRAASIRMPLNRIALRMIKDHPLIGVGLGNYEEHTYKYAPDEVSEKHHYWELLQIVHNTYLLNLAETGIPGFILYFTFIVLIFKRGFKVINKKNSMISNIGLGLLTGFLAIHVAFLAGPDGRNHQIQMIYWIYAGYLFNLSRIKLAPKKNVVEESLQNVKENFPIINTNGNSNVENLHVK